MRILVAGELNPDLVLASLTAAPEPGREVVARDFALRLGSSSAICASGLAKLGNYVALVGTAGDDVFGRFCLEQLTDAGVDVSSVRADPSLQTGLTVSISDQDRALVTYPGSMEALRADDVADSLLVQFRHLHVSSYFLQRGLKPGLPSLFRRARALGLTTSFDPGHDPYYEWGDEIHDVFRDTSVLFMNEVELELTTGSGDIEQGLRRLATDSTIAVVKLGAGGSAALDANGVIQRAPAMDVDVLDTTGAGDSFNAGFLHAWLRGWSLAKALRCGAVCGSLSTRGLGGCEAQPDVTELQEHLLRLEATAR
ncbi:MAG: carbohydrate kinase family protein [Bryobacterales bacterium]|nr:carbohydrate kinase family protein [Bryobacterales bacterium]MDE0620579.1 carbohydrate kinase family protein [Bryobacterales bacterium]